VQRCQANAGIGMCIQGVLCTPCIQSAGCMLLQTAVAVCSVPSISRLHVYQERCAPCAGPRSRPARSSLSGAARQVLGRAHPTLTRPIEQACLQRHARRRAPGTSYALTLRHPTLTLPTEQACPQQPACAAPRARYSYALQRPDYGITNYFFTQRLDPPPRAALDLPAADLEARAPARVLPALAESCSSCMRWCAWQSLCALLAACWRWMRSIHPAHPARFSSMLSEAQACSSVLLHASLPGAHACRQPWPMRACRCISTTPATHTLSRTTPPRHRQAGPTHCSGLALDHSGPLQQSQQCAGRRRGLCQRCS